MVLKNRAGQLLNEMLCELKWHCHVQYLPFDDDMERKWHDLLSEFDLKCSSLSETDKKLSEQIEELVIWTAQAWERYWSCQNQEAKASLPPVTRNFYQKYASYIQLEDSIWFGVESEEVTQIEVDFVTEKNEGDMLADLAKTHEHFVASMQEWNEFLKTKSQEASAAIEAKITATYATHSPKQAKAANKDVHAYYLDHQYKRGLDGYAKIYSVLFCDTRAILRGERPLFANFRAWWQGHGALFADTRAILSGNRPIFSNVRMFLKRRALDTEIQKIDKICESVGKQDRIRLEGIRHQLASMRNTFFSNQAFKEVVEKKKKPSPGNK